MKSQELGRRVLGAIKNDPSRHNQDSYGQSSKPEITCGTTLCVAGWACHLNGDELVWQWSGEERGYFANQVRFRDDSTGLPHITTRIEDRAQYLLGLNDIQAARIFFVGEKQALENLKRTMEGTD